MLIHSCDKHSSVDLGLFHWPGNVAPTLSPFQVKVCVRFGVCHHGWLDFFFFLFLNFYDDTWVCGVFPECTRCLRVSVETRRGLKASALAPLCPVGSSWEPWL